MALRTAHDNILVYFVFALQEDLDTLLLTSTLRSLWQDVPWRAGLSPRMAEPAEPLP